MNNSLENKSVSEFFNRELLGDKVSLELTPIEKLEFSKLQKAKPIGRKKYRGRIDIFGSFLQVCAEGNATRTRFLIRGGVSWLQIKEYVTLMIEQELITQDGKFYYMTVKGFKFLKFWEAMLELCPYLKEKFQ